MLTPMFRLVRIVGHHLTSGIVLCSLLTGPTDAAEVSLVDDLSSLRRRLATTESELRTARERLERQTHRTRLLEEQLEATRTERNQAERERHRARFRLYRSEAERELLAEQLDRAKHELERREGELRDLRARLAVLEGRSSETDQLRQDLGEREREVVRLEAELQAIRSGSEGPAGGEPTDLLEALGTERERRRTLERELARIAAEPKARKQIEKLGESLQAAGAEILVLSNRLADERRARESLEIAVERIRRESDLPPGDSEETLGRLIRAMEERRSEAERLAKELHEAKELIVRLKGQLEAAGSPGENQRLVLRLEEENRKLQEKVVAAEAVNRELRGKAALAERLAEILYGASGG